MFPARQIGSRDVPGLAFRLFILPAWFAAGIGLPAGERAAHGEEPAERPNIVFILADDLGWTDVGCYGAEYYETPNIDRLARQGVRFTDAYTNAPNCAPTRAALMSGQQYPNNPVYTVGSGARGPAAHRRMIPADNETSLPRTHVTIARRLQQAGYATCHIGKWHLGEPGESGPREHGFDVNIAGTHAGHPRTYFSPYRNPELPDGPEGEYLTDRLAAEAVRFIEAHRRQPFFLYLSHYTVHTPIQAPDERVRKYADRPAVGGHHDPVYAAMVESLDLSVGRVLEALERLELAERTIVVFYSDNGGVGGYGPQGRNITDNAPLRGGKGQLYEGGIRVPLLVRYPPLTPAGADCSEPVTGTDFYPTLLELAGLEAADDYPLDGTSLVPLLRDPSADLPRESLVWHFPGYLQGYGDLRWRLTPAGAIRRGEFKLIEFFEDDRVELYNLREDIGETRDLASRLPEKASELRAELDAWRKRVEAPMPVPKP